MATNPTSTPSVAPIAQVSPPVLPPHPDLTRPPVGAAGGPEIPPTVPLTVEEYHRLRDLERQFSEHQKQQQEVLDAKEREKALAQAQKGDIEKALAETERRWQEKHDAAVTRYQQLEQQVYNESKSSVIAQAFANRVFVGATPEQQTATAAMVRRLLQDDFEAVRDATGAVQVLDRVSRRPATQVITEKLNSPEFAIFFSPTHRGGSGSDASRAPATSQQPETYLEKVVADWNARQANPQYQGVGFRPIARK